MEVEKFGDPVVPDYEIPYHTEIMQKFDGIDLDAAGKVAGNGFYYLWEILQDFTQQLFLMQRFHDRQRIHILYTSLYDKKQRSNRCYEL